MRTKDAKGRFVRVPAKDRFWSKVDQSGGPDACWPWTGPVRKNGYGYTTDFWDKILAHRMAFKLANGEIPRGKQVCHACDNPPCCNPKHLWAGSQSENLLDRNAKGRSNQRRGEDDPKAKLTEDQVRAIRAAYVFRGGPSKRALAEQYGVSEWAIKDIIYRKTWRHVK